jgi:uncharacterized membrane-anchored protein
MKKYMEKHAKPVSGNTSTRRMNMRTALILLCVVLILFCGIILAQSLRTLSVGLIVLGLAIFAFVMVAIRWNGRR